MAEYVLAAEAEYDLLEIGRYTTQTWSVEQAVQYLTRLDEHFEAVAREAVLEKAVFKHRDDYRVSRCHHHYVFFVRDGAEPVRILAILHERMDLLAHFRDRLSSLS